MAARATRCLLAVVLLAGLACGCSERSETPPAEERESAAAPASTSGLPRLIELGSDSCAPCKAMAPILGEMRETFEGQLVVEFIDVRRDPGAVNEYGVRLIPTQVFLDPEGNELFRHEGFFAREEILATWREHGYEFEG
jgi:thioredoxin 1